MEILLNGISRDELSKVIKEAVRSELQTLKTSDTTLKTRKEAAQKLRISTVTFDKLAAKGDVEGFRVGNKILYRSSDLEKALETRMRDQRKRF